MKTRGQFTTLGPGERCRDCGGVGAHILLQSGCRQDPRGPWVEEVHAQNVRALGQAILTDGKFSAVAAIGHTHSLFDSYWETDNRGRTGEFVQDWIDNAVPDVVRLAGDTVQYWTRRVGESLANLRDARALIDEEEEGVTS